MLHDLSRQLRRLMKDAARSNFGQRQSSSRSLSGHNVIRLRNPGNAASFRTPLGWRNRLLMKRGVRMHATSVERGDGCAIAILDQRGVVHGWHDSLPDATAFDFTILGAHVSQFYLPQDVALFRPDRGLIAASLHGSETQQGWHRRPGGAIFWGITVIEPIYLKTGELHGYSHVTRFAQDPRNRVSAHIRATPPQYPAFHGAVAAA
jgi:hypothetical protein